ncbi:gamma-glutamylcyclotransferase [Limimaricola pyoseonensis]|uniref:glutathione-specific gamma-glutamylcyclotransferase n=1 Tax=Limimaricola pyoseonensis TaxID=521013 RepID=A0A1G7CF24_9RHOB|nr:gamma-glutamylcyclotransferase [Limimaricola pyoseonensis]SDE37879.1 cation transport protein ChaC [Limimaricola pyoseonensis]
MTDQSALWVFGYGSLLWNPGFRPEEVVVARLDGWHRSFCMSSIHHRGTPERPGLVLALDRAEGAVCTGLALRAPEAERDRVLEMLRERELVSSAYLETHQDLALTDGRVVPALTYVIDPKHEQYVALDLETQARRISAAVGGRGPNDEYLYNTAAHLEEMGVHDPDLDWLVGRVRSLKAGV